MGRSVQEKYSDLLHLCVLFETLTRICILQERTHNEHMNFAEIRLFETSKRRISFHLAENCYELLLPIILRKSKTSIFVLILVCFNAVFGADCFCPMSV